MTNKKMRLWNAKLGENAAYSHKTSISWEHLKRVQRGCSGGLFCIFTHVDTQTSTITREQISGMFLIKGGNPLIISAAEWTHKSHQCTTVYPWYQNHPDYLCELCSNSCEGKYQLPKATLKEYSLRLSQEKYAIPLHRVKPLTPRLSNCRKFATI